MQEQGDLGRDILKGVSRSFYLSLRLLPRLMQGPLSLGYLLARASDTIADTEEVDVSLRVRCLSMFEEAMVDTAVRATLIESLQEEFIDAQTNQKEQMLLKRLDDVFAWYDSSWEWVWIALKHLMNNILQGQILDLETFAVNGKGEISNDDDLLRYCYLVAGCVGEYWSEVGCQTDSEFSSLDRDSLDKKGVAFGRGLQLVNILRDLPKDMHHGRSYLPGVTKGNEAHMLREAKRWRAKARKLVAHGFDYGRSLRQKRARVAVVLPALLAEETLDLLDSTDLEEWQNGVKVSRSTVRKCVVRAFLGRY